MILVRLGEESVTGRADGDLRGMQAVWSAVSGHIPQDLAPAQLARKAWAFASLGIQYRHHCIQGPEPVAVCPTAGKN